MRRINGISIEWIYERQCKLSRLKGLRPCYLTLSYLAILTPGLAHPDKHFQQELLVMLNILHEWLNSGGLILGLLHKGCQTLRGDVEAIYCYDMRDK